MPLHGAGWPEPAQVVDFSEVQLHGHICHYAQPCPATKTIEKGCTLPCFISAILYNIITAHVITQRSAS
ncbi:hypothetical protein RSOLAG1IB_03145 [Rhizoctonia solani AG-1 IB]|uniref:Uncharacterized protein n=1 Tax=Thanatephorus cucumeris (strain AG1-IB / isolate 7/3/14) TaxID=1108050 RepID=A0A0B7FSP2_THACB|nr:hypothetical protein RSOLAG1IB_03145 [Rhizoctonia solani AG-1 IB]